MSTTESAAPRLAPKKRARTWGTALIDDFDQGLFLRDDLADFYGGNSSGMQGAGQGRCIIFGNRDQKASSGLRVEEKSADVFWNGRIVLDQAFGKVAVGLEAARNVTGADALQRAFQHRYRGGLEDQTDVRGEGHFAGVADQAEAGNVGQGMDLKGAARRLSFEVGGDYLGGGFVESGHRLGSRFDPFRLRYGFFDRGGDDSGPQCFCE